MTVYNTAFFKSIETTFIILKEWHGEEKALEFLAELMKRSLGAAYNAMNPGKGVEEFKRCVGARDAAVGLKVSFHDLRNGFAYRFFTDPFPGLKGKVDSEKLDATFMKFKVKTLLGKEWDYKTTKHLWKGDAFTEHLITKIKP